ISLRLDSAAAQKYVIRKARSGIWLPPIQAYLLRSLLADVDAADAGQAREALSVAVHNASQIMALANDLSRLGRIDFPFHASPGKSVWLAYGDEPWLITVTSTASFTPPVVLAVSSKKIAPPGVTLLAATSESSLPLGEGFVDLDV